MMKKLLFFSFLFCTALAACDKAPEEPDWGTVITSISPTTALPRDEVVITGSGFKPNGTNTVIFPGNRIAKVTAYSTTEIRTVVPDEGVTAGPIAVRTGHTRFAYSPEDFIPDTSTPVIYTINPTRGLAGHTIAIRGINFSQTGNVVTFGDVQAQVVSQNTRQVNVTVPDGLPEGVVNVTVTNAEGVVSAPIQFAVGIYFRDDFNRPNTSNVTSSTSPNPIGDHWTVLSGTFLLNSNYLRGQSAGIMVYNDPEAVCTSGNGSSFRLRLDGINTGEASGVYFGVVFHVQNLQDYYVLRFSGTSLQFLAYRNGVQSVLVNDSSFAGNTGITHSGTGANPPDFLYRIEISSSTPGVFNVKISNATDPDTVIHERTLTDPSATPHTGGMAGVVTGNTSSVILAYFDNFELMLK